LAQAGLNISRNPLPVSLDLHCYFCMACVDVTMPRISHLGLLATKVVETIPERGVAPLGRAWRTPDPSPSRVAAELPSCKPRSWWEMEDSISVSDEERNGGLTSSSPLHASSCGLGPAHLNLRESRARCSNASAESNSETACLFSSRTPSPSPSPSPCSANEVLPGSKPARSKGRSSISTVYTESEASSGFSPRGSFSFSSSADIRICPFNTVSLPFVNPGGMCSGQAVPPPPPAPPMVRELLGLPDDCPSVGSLNHPHSCADFCKYAKKAKGCKDGEACVRCHICTKRKPRPRPYQVEAPDVAETP